MAQQATRQSHSRQAVSSSRLTRNERLVLTALDGTDGPMKAYELLNALKTDGIKAPMTVYRALERLETKGLIHKLDGMNAFVVCNHDTPHAVQTFLICVKCSKVQEIEEDGIGPLKWSTLTSLTEPQGFKAEGARIEIRGRCTDCQKN